jgi:hypothetical protein
MEQTKPRKIPVVVWAPFFDRGRFQYWKDVGRGNTIIDAEGLPYTEFYNDAHATGGSIWTRVLPEGKTPQGLPDDEQEQPKRSTRAAEHEE